MVSLDAIRQELGVYRHLVGVSVRGQMQYKVSFALQLISNGALTGLELAAIFILFDHFESLGGWSPGEIAFLYSVSSMSFGIAKIIASSFDDFSHEIVRGSFDRFLIRPASPLIQTLGSDLQLRQFGRFFQGTTAFVIALSLINIDWTIWRILFFPIVIVSASVLFVAVLSLEASMCFWTTEASEAVNAVTYGGQTLAQYPLDVFDIWLRRLFLWAIPLGFTVFMPSLYLLNKPDPLDLPDFARFVSPVVAIVFSFVASILWRFGVRHYRSTGT